MAEEKDTAAPAKRTAGKTGRRKKPEAEHAARAAPQDKDTGSKAQEILEQARTEPKPEWEVAEQVVLLPLDRLRPFKNHPFKAPDLSVLFEVARQVVQEDKQVSEPGKKPSVLAMLHAPAPSRSEKTAQTKSAERDLI